MASSFQKVCKQKEKIIRGTKVSIQNAQLLTSTGISNLDYYLGGGLPIGTIFMIEEGSDTSYSKLALKYFLAEGIVHKHCIFLSSSEAETIIKTLPGLNEEALKIDNSKELELMKIAWRYQDLPVNKDNSPKLNEKNHSFNLGEVMSETFINECQIVTHNVKKDNSNQITSYDELLKCLVPIIRSFSTSNPPNGNLLRVVLDNIGGPLWNSNLTDQVFVLAKFLSTLRSLARFSYTVFLITIPTQLYHELSCINKLRLFADYVIEFEPLAKIDNTVNPAFKDYHGLFHFQKRSAINSIIPFISDTSDLVFRSTRKCFIIEKLHLPPDLSETMSRSNEDPKIARERIKSLACGASSGHNKLDF